MKLRCTRIELGTFSSELTCYFDAYDRDGKKVDGSLYVPIGYVDEKLKTVRVRVHKNLRDKTQISIAVGGGGDFESFTVPSSNLVDLV